MYCQYKLTLFSIYSTIAIFSTCILLEQLCSAWMMYMHVLDLNVVICHSKFAINFNGFYILYLWLNFQVNTLIDKLDRKGNPYKLRCVTLKDPTTTSTVRCKLWGHYAEEDISTSTTYTFKNVEVNDSSGDGQLDIQTTDLTKIMAKRNALPITQNHEIIGLHRR